MTDATGSNPPAKSPRTEPLAVPGLPEDWDRMATERVVGLVDQVKIKSSGPAIAVARAAVFGILGSILAMIAGILFLIGLIRGLEQLVGLFIDDGVWLVYLLIGSFFSLIGFWLWSKRPKGAAS